MKRRLVLTAGALVAALSLSSCSTFDHSDVAATVNGHELTRDQLDALVATQLATLTDNAGKADAYRTALTGWVQLVLMEGAAYQGVPVDESAASSRRQAAFASLVREPSDGQWLYETGPARSGVGCLSAILTDELQAATAAADALGEGQPFDSVFAEYNKAPSLDATGGVLSPEGSDCASLDALSNFGIPADELVDLSIGESTGAIQIEGVYIVLRAREWSEVSSEWQQLFTDGAVPAKVREGDVSIASRFGTWDPVDLSVVGAAAG